MYKPPSPLPRCLMIVVFCWTLTATVSADIRLPAIFSDHMVLQRDTAVRVWGWADAAEMVTVSIADQKVKTQANGDGQWSVELSDLQVGGPHHLTIAGKNRIRIEDVLVGEVWLGSGQSNMAMQVSRAMDYESEQSAANLPQIRMFTVARNPQRKPQEDCQGQWQICSPETVGGFSATAYFFGQHLHEKLEFPVGLINSSYGGTDIAAWTSEDVQREVPPLRALLDKWIEQDEQFDLDKATAVYEKRLTEWKDAAREERASGRKVGRAPQKPVPPALSQNHPANLFNGMIAPLIPYTIRGAIWYQGERNSNSTEAGLLYRKQLPLLIQDWRSRWGDDFPFAWVQLPNFNRSGDGWMLVRESMLQSLSVENTGMAITVDVGDPSDIHPKNKQAVGRRLAMWALASVYEQAVAASGPIHAGHHVRDDKIVVSFHHCDGGLVAQGGGTLRGFEIAGKDRTFRPAEAQIDGDHVIVSNAQVSQPVAVRYAWAANPDCNLFNQAGLPASPFRTDDW